MPYKLKVKLGPNEFEAEGDKTDVERQYAKFLEIVGSAPTGRQGAQTAASGTVDTGNLDPALFDRVFRVDKDGVVSLKKQPQGDQAKAHAIVLVIYGYRAVAKEDMVLANRITRGMEASGLKIERVDRFLGPIDRYLTKGGTRSGSRYGLNNPGVVFAEELIHGLCS